jgi:hypothetical protein
VFTTVEGFLRLRLWHTKATARNYLVCSCVSREEPAFFDTVAAEINCGSVYIDTFDHETRIIVIFAQLVQPDSFPNSYDSLSHLN